MAGIDWDLIEREFDPHPDGEARVSALMKNMGGLPLTDEDREHLKALRKLYGVNDAPA